MANCNCRVPEDVLINILSRLPVKFLMLFKSVCKPWQNLIQTPFFNRKHLLCQNIFTDNCLLVLKYNSNERLGAMVVSCDPDDDVAITKELDIPCFSAVRSPSLVGSSKGIVCLAYSSPRNKNICIVLCNPFTGKFKLLPAPHHFKSNSNWRFSKSNLGFCFDSKSSDFKIVVITSFTVVDASPSSPSSLARVYTLRSNSLAEVYTLRSNSWKSVDCPAKLYFSDGGGFTDMDGVCYWVVGDGNRTPIILCFNMATDMFQHMSLPGLDDDQYCGGVMRNVIGLRGYVAVISCRDEFPLVFDIVMKANTINTWIRYSRIVLTVYVDRPIGFWLEGGEFIFKAREDRGFVSYNLQTQVITNLGDLGVVVYKPSLVSLEEA